MVAQSNPRVIHFLQVFVKAAVFIAIGASLAALAGWIFDIPFLRSILPNASPIKSNTTLTIPCAALSLWCLRKQAVSSRQKLIGEILAIFIILMGSLSLSQYVFEWDLGIDQLLINNLPAVSSTLPNRMSPVTAVCFILLGMALLLLGTRRALYLSLSVLVLSLLATIGYLFDYQALYQIAGFGSIALPTAFAFLILSLGTLAARPTVGGLKLITSNMAAGRTVRFLFPATVLLIIFLGWAVEEAEQFRILDTRHESVVLVVLLIMLYSPLIYLYARRIHRTEQQILQMKRLYATLSQVNQTIARAKQQDELYQTICDAVARFGEFELAWIGLLDEDTGNVQPVAAAGLSIAQWPFPTINIYSGSSSNTLVARALRTYAVITSDDMQSDKNLETVQSQFQKYVYHSAAAIPFRLRGKAIGVLALASNEMGQFQAAEEVHLLEEMSMDISFALDHLENESERLQTEERLQESEELFRTAFQFSPIGMSLTTLDGRFQTSNQSFTDMLGYSKEELKGKHFNDITHPEDVELGIDALRKLSDGEVSNLSYEKRYIHKNGETIWAFVSVALLKDSLETPVYFIAQILDITKRKQAEAAYEASQKYLQALIEHAPDGIALLGMDGKLRQVTRSTESILGFTLDEAKGQDPAQLTHPDDLPALLTAINDLLQNPRKVIRTEYRFQHKDGSWRYLESTISNMLHEPSLEAVVFNYRDITERKQAEEKLRRSQETYQELFENNPHPMWVYDLETLAFRMVNDAAVEHYGYSNEEFLDMKITDIRPQEEISALLDNVADNSLPLKKSTGWKHRKKDGTLIDVEITSHAIQFEEKPARLVLASDITDRKRYEEKLRALNAELEQRVADRTAELYRSNAELEQANRAKDEFLANMSHELRTPLNSIMGVSESLLEERRGSLNAYQQNSLQIIEESGQHLLALINDILDLSKIEAGKFDFYPQSISVDDLCRSSLSFIKAQAAKKFIIVTYQNQSEVTEIIADVRRLKQVLVNLLTNAVKFTPERGHVTLRVTTKLEQNLIQFAVIDDGVGISPEDLQRLFQPFVQVDSSLNRQYEGTGLGLALVQKLVDLHAGSIQVESEVGKGSCFTINLACKPDEMAKIEEAQTATSSANELKIPASEASRGQILLAEDNTSNILTIGEYLESHAYKVEVAHDGLEAITKAEESNPGLILMDIQMPAMNGLEAIARLRADVRFSTTPIIALTALAMPGDRERCLQAGATEYLSKPVSLKMLLEVIEHLIEHQV